MLVTSDMEVHDFELLFFLFRTICITIIMMSGFYKTRNNNVEKERIDGFFSLSPLSESTICLDKRHVEEY